MLPHASILLASLPLDSDHLQESIPSLELTAAHLKPPPVRVCDRLHGQPPEPSVDANDQRFAQRIGSLAQKLLIEVRPIDTVSVIAFDPKGVQRVWTCRQSLQVRKRQVRRPLIVAPTKPAPVPVHDELARSPLTRRDCHCFSATADQ